MILQNLVTQGIGTPILPGGLAFSATNMGATGSSSPVAYPAFRFMAETTGQLSSATWYFSANSGSPTDVRVSLYADDGTGKPVSTGPIANSEGSGIAIIGAAYNTLSFGAGASVVRGNLYHAVVKNYTAGTTATPNAFATLAGMPAQVYTTTYSAGTADTWAAATAGRAGLLITTTGGDTYGQVYAQSAAAYNSNANRCFGSKFVSPLYWFRCRGLLLNLYKAGTISGTVALRLYVNGILAGEGLVPAGSVAGLTSSSMHAYASIGPVTIPPNSSCMVVAAYSGGDGTNYLRQYHYLPAPGQASPLQAMYVLSTDGGFTWTASADRFAPFWLLGAYDINNNEFADFPVNRRQFNAQR